MEVLEKELPGDNNEEKRRHLLAGLLCENHKNFLEVILDQEVIIIQDEALKPLPRSAVIALAKHYVTATMLSRLKLTGWNDGANPQKAYKQCISIIAALNEPKGVRVAQNGGEYVSIKSSGWDTPEDKEKRKVLLQDVNAREVGLANKADVVIKFLYKGLNEKEQRQVTRNQDDYRILSPVWRTVQNNPPVFTPDIPAPVTPDGVFYSQLDVPAASRVTSQQATKEANSFLQDLSNILNKDKLHHERKAVTPLDVEVKNNARVLAAEQQALATIHEGAEGRKAAENARAEGLVTEQRLQEKIQELETRLEASGKEREAADKELVEARKGLEEEQERLTQENRKLISENLEQKRRIKAFENKAADTTAAMNALIEQLRGAVEKPAGFLGGGLKKTIEEILANVP